MCDNNPDTPFCSPQDGAQLQVGEIAEITWNPNFFTTSNPDSDPPQQIFIQADFAITTTNGPSETAGFTSAPLDPNTGTFPWTILTTYLPPNSNTTTATLSLAAPLSHAPTTTNSSTNTGTFVRIGAATIRFPGPRVHILRSDNNNSNTNTATLTTTTNNTDTGNAPLTTPSPQPTPETAAPVNPLAIALPIVLGLLTALAMALYAVLKRHRPDLLARLLGGWRWCSCLGRVWGRGRRGQVAGAGAGAGAGMGGYGYGEQEGGGGGSKRVKLKGRKVEIRVVKTDLEGLRGNARRMMGGDGNGGGDGEVGNVFREEMRRQELARGRI